MIKNTRSTIIFWWSLCYTKSRNALFLTIEGTLLPMLAINSPSSTRLIRPLLFLSKTCGNKTSQLICHSTDLKDVPVVLDLVGGQLWSQLEGVQPSPPELHLFSWLLVQKSAVGHPTGWSHTLKWEINLTCVKLATLLVTRVESLDNRDLYHAQCNEGT